ncbi:DUF6049 family protein [Amnibacterium endophyticum]|uniref:DUF6049 family protein n=1 Tax=Amnibacterium endophyticum TaxID=2109337 RepID=A0ABW4LB02_9MICO
MRAGRVLAAAVAAALASVPLAAVPAVAAVTASPVSLVVAPENGGILREGQPLDVVVRISNGGTERVPAGRLALSMTRGPVASTEELLTLPGQLQGLLLTRTSARTPALEPGASADVDVRIPVKDLDETLSPADGARLLDVQLQASGVRVLAQSAVTRVTRSADRIGFGTVIPITIPAGRTGIVDAAEQRRLTGEDGAWTAALDAARAMPAATIALDPAVPASIRLAGDAAPASATDFLAALETAGNETVRLPYADGDLTLQRAAGLSEPLAPLSFAGATSTATSTSTTAPTPVATPAPTSSTSADDPTAWDWSDVDVAWPVPGTTSAADLGALASDGAVLLGSGDVEDTPARAAAGPLATIGGHRVLVADAVTSGLLATAAADDDVAGRSATAALVGALATDAVSGAAPTVLAVAGRGADAAGLARVLSLLDRQPWIRGSDASELVSQAEPAAVRLKPGTVPASRVTAVRGLLAAENRIQQVAKAAVDPDALVGPYRLTLLGLVSTAWREDETGWATASTEAARAFAAMPQQVSIVPTDRALVSTDGALTVQVRNALPQAITVDVTATTNNNRLRFEGAGRVQVAANSTNKTQLSFRSISNGRSTVDLRLVTPQGVVFGDPVARAVTVRAGFDTVVAVILLTGLAVLLALGVYRNVKRRRRPRAER